MRVCIIKQLYDIYGPNTSFLYNNVTIDDIFNFHISKYNGLESYLLFDADSYIINSYNFKRHECEVIENNTLDGNSTVKEIYYKNLGEIIQEKDIPYDKYDVIWCRDPILNNIKELKQKYPKKLFIYEEVEHERGNSNKSRYYDLILKHNWMNCNNNIKIPMTIAYPYPKCPDKIRNIINIKKKNQLYIDYRDICKYRNIKQRAFYKKEIREYLELNKHKYLMPITCNLKNSLSGCCFSFEGKSDVKEYLSLMGESKYFSSTFGRVGQALVDAVCLNCICFGTNISPNHRLICHPFTVFNNFQSIESIFKKIKQIESNKKLEEEILAYQNERLYKYYVNYQKNILNKALITKINSVKKE